ncbi:MAG: PQQ-binding-like beta-propeller repeat protein, partial [Planctomycetota bacterium]|nr:PQQ-binding-like beta-propeller repeat protein [Planctomycetota bacterium]
RIDFDYAFQPVAAGGLVYFGSSADDTVRAIDAATGKIRWSVTTSGPVRFAPHVYDGKCYAASDDGFVYCLDARTGKTIWKFQATPQDRQMVSDGRMISRWPCRTGVLVLDGVVYVTAGMWPFEGIYIYALDAKSGKVRWVNDTSGSRYMAYPHSGSYALGGVAPQGYLLASEKILLVPTGRSAPAGFDRSTGRFLYYHSANKRNGGSWATIARDIFFNPAHEGAPDLHIELGQSGPRSGDGMLAYSLASGSAQWGIPNRHRIVADDRALYAIGGGKAEAFDFSKETRGKLKWEAQHSRVWSAARSKEALLIGGRGSITAFSTADGRQVWRGETDGEVRGLAIADGRIIASTEKGTIYCFASGKGDSAFSDERKISREEPREETQTSSTDHFIKRIRLANITRGFAIVIGQEDARPAEAIADQTDLHVISVLRDKSKVLAERARLIGRGDVYGSRVVIHHAENPARLPYAQYFANVVVVVGSSGKLSGKELYRILRPCGGLMIFEGIAPESVEKLISQADIPKAERRISDTTLEVVRGKLPGAFDWDSKVTCDHRVRWPLEMLWAGGLGPARMVNRHWKPSTPLAANGRTFVLGEYHIVAVDTYNGTELWSREIGKIFANRTAVSADDQSVYVNFKDHCLELDAQSGKTRKLHGRPALSRHFSLQEPQTFVLEVDDTHSGTIRVSKTDAGIEIVLLTDDPKVTAGDTWNLYFDFRPASKRTAFYGPGAFEGTVVPALPGNPNPASWVKGAGRMHPTPNLKQEPVEGGTKVIFGLEREQLQSFTGTLPKDFTFAA